MKKLSLIIFFLFLTFLTYAGGPKQIAKINRSLWPYSISSTEGFDFASKMEMLVFTELLEQYENITPEDTLKKYLGLQSMNMTSINTWKSKIKNILIQNLEHLSSTGANDFVVLSPPYTYEKIAKASAELKRHIPDNLKAWYEEAKGFYNRYIYEQMRLAALFPKITSEILTLDNSEIIGTEYKDKEFLLTFDDGPTRSNGSTDKLIGTLKQNNINGVFFVLGDMFDARLKSTSAKQLHDLYGNNIVGSHGKIHQSHQKYAEWQQSISFTSHLIDSVIPENHKLKYFRPPYGQRNQKIVEYVNRNNTRIMLWNIDSQDWNAKITSAEVADRMITLMLLWRRGILLFHDVRPKANEALPIIWKQLNNAGIKWKDL